MEMLGIIERVFRMVIGLGLLAWFGYGFYITSAARDSELAVRDSAPSQQSQQSFAPEPGYSTYDSADSYSAPMDDTQPTASDW